MNIYQIPFADFAPTGVQAVFWTYYRTLLAEAGGTLPKRTDFDPLKIAPVLHTMAVSEYVDEETQLVRLIGGGHDSLWPVNIAGENLLHHLDTDTATARRAAYKEIISRPCGCLIDDDAIDKNDRTINYSGLILPTLSAEGNPTIFIGCYGFEANDLEMQRSVEAGIQKRVTKSITYIDLGLTS